MKKVLSVALASAMVLGMGANAFAISYSTNTHDEADWPKDFQFYGDLFVTDADGDIIKESVTTLNDSEPIDFQPGDTIWMPLYAEDQVEYTANINEGTEDKIGVSSIKIDNADFVVDATGSTFKSTRNDTNTDWSNRANLDTWTDAHPGYVLIDEDGNEVTNVAASLNAGETYTFVYVGEEAKVNIPDQVKVDGETRDIDTVRIVVGGRTFSGKVADVEEKVNAYLADQKGDFEEYVTPSISGTANVEAEEGEDTTVDKAEVDSTADGVTVDFGHYTGNIDKNWSINLIEDSTGVAELIEKAELYKATKEDYASYIGTTNEIMPNAVYLKITLKDSWKTVDEETLKYYVYIADNSNKNNKTNEVWVSGTYANNDWEYVDFTWTNNAAEAQLWKVKKGENGTAVFDFADKAFFTVKMYSGESMYLDLSTAYDKVIAGEMDAEADSFYKFDNENANFSRTGELIIVSDDSSLIPYEIDEDGNFVEVDAKYVENYAIAHTNKKVDGFVFTTNTLGNYVLSTEELGQEEQPAEETPAEPVTPSEPTQETPAPETSKPNPATGAEDFVGLAVSLAVVSVAAAGALALKK